MPTARELPNIFTTRTCGMRNQSKPGTYWPSMVNGMSSLRGNMPAFSAVNRLQVWPNKRYQSCCRLRKSAKKCRTRGEKLELWLLLPLVEAPPKSASI